jgi:hypothetical protein
MTESTRQINLDTVFQEVVRTLDEISPRLVGQPTTTSMFGVPLLRVALRNKPALRRPEDIQISLENGELSRMEAHCLAVAWNQARDFLATPSACNPDVIAAQVAQLASNHVFPFQNLANYLTIAGLSAFAIQEGLNIAWPDYKECEKRLGL